MTITFVGNFHVDYSSENHHAKTLELLGHKVIRMQEGQTTTNKIFYNAVRSDLLVFIHTHGWKTRGTMTIETMFKELRKFGVPSITYHLDLWFGLQRQKDLESDPFYKSIDYFFTVDKLMADWFNENTNVKGRFMRAGVFQKECYIHESDWDGKDIVFVGSKGYHQEWEYRPKLINWLKETYGESFTHVGGDGEVKTTRGDALNTLYATSKIVIGDTLCIGYDYPYYTSDRVYETMGRGGFIIHPYIKGMEEEFEDKKDLVFYEYGNFDQLKQLIDYYLDNHNERLKIRTQGHLKVKNNYTYTHRWKSILEEVKNG